MDHLIQVRDLTVQFSLPEGIITAVNGVSFGIPPGSTVALVGESGSGKTVVSQSIMGLLPATASITAGKILFAEPKTPTKAVNISALDPCGSDMRAIRGDSI